VGCEVGCEVGKNKQYPHPSTENLPIGQLIQDVAPGLE
jgi:hypothetical protein